MTYFLQPFDNRTDGVFGRTSVGWYTTDAGLVVEAAANARRVVDRAGVWWIWIEGARENLLGSPLDLTAAVDWIQPALHTTVEVPPTGGAAIPIGRLEGGETIAQTFTSVVSAAKVATTVYARGTVGALTFDAQIVNGTPGGPTTVAADETAWVREHAAPQDLSAGGAKAVRFDNTSDNVILWGAVVEMGPAAASAPFASQPILVQGTRELEVFHAGLVTQAMVDRVITHVRITVEPEFTHAINPPGFVAMLVYFDTGVAATSVRLWLETVGSHIRARGGDGAGFVSSGALEFSRGQALTLTLELATGSLTVAGATLGDGTFTAGAYDLLAGSEALIGHDPADALHAFGLLSPVFLGFVEMTVTDIEQVALNAAAVRFSEPVLMFDPAGSKDALNVDHYDLAGTPGIPGLQCVLPGATDDEVILYFDGSIDQGALVQITIHDIVAAGVPVGIAPTVGSFLGYGPERNAAVVRETLFPRVDLANPQRIEDAPQGAALGTIPITDTGDLGNVTGRAYLRKRIDRRVSTMPRGFVVLGDTYGFRPGAKTLIRPTDLRRLQSNAEAQVRSEPGVVAARVLVREAQPGLVTMRIIVTDDEGSFEMTGQVDFNAE